MLIFYMLYILETSKRPRLDQIPAANLDADDAIDEDVSSMFMFTVSYYDDTERTL